jgi:hypothetical protein
MGHTFRHLPVQEEEEGSREKRAIEKLLAFGRIWSDLFRLGATSLKR